MGKLHLQFDKIYDQLHTLCEVISSKSINTSMNGKNVTCEDGLHFDNHDESNCGVNDQMPTLHDNSFGANLEPQEISFGDSFLVSLEESLESASSKNKIA